MPVVPGSSDCSEVRNADICDIFVSTHDTIFFGNFSISLHCFFVLVFNFFLLYTLYFHF